ncbi:MAG: DUF72 domain-containing protein [Planctomycetota bacterium]|nr:DUF72 domain-containing protein [Planctomycetota bacterium]
MPVAGRAEQKANAGIRIGTCGYSYAEWVESGFYPAGTKGGEMLRAYAEHFSVTELNYTWYQLPKASAIERQRKQAPAGFLFAAKLTRTMTHEVAADWRTEVARYRDGIRPLQEARQLAAVLVQLPPEFGRTLNNRKHLAVVLNELEGLPLAVEFRNGTWNHERVFGEFERRGVTLVAVDEPDLPGLFPALNRVTSPQFYVRFHGRNAKGWRTGNMQSKFDYSYSDKELLDWSRRYLEPMAARAKTGLVFFNNHVRAQAARNALALLRLLRSMGLEAG